MTDEEPQMTAQRDLDREARRLARLLQNRRLRIVFAESCTGGLVSATMTRVPGISEFHCGSAVVYRVATKNRWLRIPKKLLEDPGPVSREVAAEMARRVLDNTPEADLAASVTGHLGPDAPKGEDGLVYIGVAVRPERSRRGTPPARVEKHRLEPDPEIGKGLRLRRRRQRSATALTLRAACSALGD